MSAAPSLPPLAVYVHFPWCVSKCPYCDFNSHALREVLPEDRYVVRADRRPARAGSRAQWISRRHGRSPACSWEAARPACSLQRRIARVIEALRAALPLSADTEITMEANPATVERGRFAEYRAVGVNRVSLGAQSFDPAALKALGRIHKVADVYRAAEELHACGLTNFNLDLMYALPGTDRGGLHWRT